MRKSEVEKQDQIIIYKAEDGQTQIDELKKIVALQEKVISGHQLKTGETEGLIHIISSYSEANREYCL